MKRMNLKEAIQIMLIAAGAAALSAWATEPPRIPAPLSEKALVRGVLPEIPLSLKDVVFEKNDQGE